MPPWLNRVPRQSIGAFRKSPPGWNELPPIGVETDVFGFLKTDLVNADDALPGRERPILTLGARHEVLGTAIDAVPEGAQVAYFALGCFWGAEKLFWQLPGVITTAVGYAGGYTPNPTYEEVCTGRTGHTETVQVVYDPSEVTYDDLLAVFWENHDPTQGMRQGNDCGTQYRSAIFTTSTAQAVAANASKEDFATRLHDANFGTITTEIRPTAEFYFAERYHQQYLFTHKDGYCPIHATGVKCG
jgi:peptide-methionine (S)-S-oxide reductase